MNAIEIDRDRLRELANAATPGMWAHCYPGQCCGGRCVDPVIHGDDELLRVDAEFVAAANPVGVLALLDELDAAEARIAAVRDAAKAIEFGSASVIIFRDAAAHLILRALDNEVSDVE